MLTETSTRSLTDKTLLKDRQGEVFAGPEGSKASSGARKHFYIESYGCQMNFSDSEIVASMLQNHGFDVTSDLNIADLILINTCSIREKAEETVRKRLKSFQQVKKNIRFESDTKKKVEILCKKEYNTNGVNSTTSLVKF